MGQNSPELFVRMSSIVVKLFTISSYFWTTESAYFWLYGLAALLYASFFIFVYFVPLRNSSLLAPRACAGPNPCSTSSTNHRRPNVVNTVGATLAINVDPTLGMAVGVTLRQPVGSTLRQR